jgi:hypothetical protein
MAQSIRAFVGGDGRRKARAKGRGEECVLHDVNASREGFVHDLKPGQLGSKGKTVSPLRIFVSYTVFFGQRNTV